MKDIESVVLIEKQDSTWKIHRSHLQTEQAREALRRNLPQQVAELTIDTSKRDEKNFPYLLQQHFPDHLKGNNNGTFKIPVYVFGREITSGDVLHVAFHKNPDDSLKEVVGVPMASIENYEILHEFYKF